MYTSGLQPIVFNKINGVEAIGVSIAFVSTTPTSSRLQHKVHMNGIEGKDDHSVVGLGQYPCIE